MRSISLSAILLALAVFVTASPSVDQAAKRQFFPSLLFFGSLTVVFAFPPGEDLGKRQGSSVIPSLYFKSSLVVFTFPIAHEGSDW